MTVQRGGYKGATRCTSGPQPGVWGAMDWFLSAYKSKGGVNSGIYNCRSVRGGSTTSLHGEGRAADFGIRPYSAAYGTQLANAIVKMSKELGVQCVIFNRKIWSSSYPDRWRPYTGVASHRDHIHVEFMWGSAKMSRAKARALWNRVLGGGGWAEAGLNDLLRNGTKGERVAELQRALGVKDDGYFGDDTEKALREAQARLGVAVDGIAGPETLAALKTQEGLFGMVHSDYRYTTMRQMIYPRDRVAIKLGPRHGIVETKEGQKTLLDIKTEIVGIDQPHEAQARIVLVSYDNGNRNIVEALPDVNVGHLSGFTQLHTCRHDREKMEYQLEIRNPFKDVEGEENHITLHEAHVEVIHS